MFYKAWRLYNIIVILYDIFSLKLKHLLLFLCYIFSCFNHFRSHKLSRAGIKKTCLHVQRFEKLLLVLPILLFLQSDLWTFNIKLEMVVTRISKRKYQGNLTKFHLNHVDNLWFGKILWSIPWKIRDLYRLALTSHSIQFFCFVWFDNYVLFNVLCNEIVHFAFLIYKKWNVCLSMQFIKWLFKAII